MASKTDARKLNRDAQEALRQRVILAVFEDKMPQKEAVKVFRVSQAAISKWVKVYKAKGLKGLNKKKQGRPRSSGKLAGWQAAWVVRTISEKCPEQLKMPWGFTPQKPIRRAYQRNPKVISKWMREEYPKIHKQAKKENAQIFWGDEMGVKSTDQVGRSFGRRGQTPVVQTSGSRYSCNMISAISNAGSCRFMVFKERFTVVVYLKFIRKLLHKQDRKVFLIVDNHRVHHAKKVQAWLQKYQEKIAVFYLPPYAPELNPDELLNHDVKANSFKHSRPRSENELKRAVRSFMYATQKMPSKVANYFKKSELRYIAQAASA